MSPDSLHMVMFGVLSVIGGVLFIVGFSSDVWLEWTGGSSGLWRLCANTGCTRFADWPQLAGENDAHLTGETGVHLSGETGVHLAGEMLVE